MIDRLEFVEILTALAALYPRFRLEDTTAEAYYAVLSDLPAALLKAAALHLGATSKWFPAASELREAAFGLVERRDGAPSAGEAWREALRRVNIYEPPAREDFSHPLVWEALEAIGGNRVLSMTLEDALMATRAHFYRCYEALLLRRRADERMLPQVRLALQDALHGELAALAGEAAELEERR